MSDGPSLTDLENRILELQDSLEAGIGDRATLGRNLHAVNIELGKLMMATTKNPPMQIDLVEVQSAVNEITTGIGASDERKAKKALGKAMLTLDEMKALTLSQKNL